VNLDRTWTYVVRMGRDSDRIVAQTVGAQSDLIPTGPFGLEESSIRGGQEIVEIDPVVAEDGHADGCRDPGSGVV
jgi:hypothetical protein